MKIDSRDFIKQLDPLVYDICVEISRRGFILTLTGGAPRDFLLNGVFSKDLDFEIKHLFEFDHEQWQRKLSGLFKHLNTKFDIQHEELEFLIYRIKVNNFELEFSSPRIEKANNNLDHKYFTPEFVSNLETEKAFARRDLTINAIGIYFGVPGTEDEFTVIDPFHGIDHLKEKVLKHITPSFSLDYVRLLRLVRFKCLHSFSIDTSTNNLISNFSLQMCSHYYLSYEFEKSVGRGPYLQFFHTLWQIIEDYSLGINEVVASTKIFYNLDLSSQSLYQKHESLFKWTMFHLSLSREEKLQFVKCFGLSKKKAMMMIHSSESIERVESGVREVDCFDRIVKCADLVDLSFTTKDLVHKYQDLLANTEFQSKDQYQKAKENILKSL